MAWTRIQKDMQTFFTNASDGLRKDMDQSYVHWIDINYRSAALGFHKAAQKISAKSDYMPDGHQQFINIIKNLCATWNTGAKGTHPGDIFRSVAMRNGTIKNISISNVKIIETRTGGVTIQITVPSNTGDLKATTFLTNFRKLVWKEFNQIYTQTQKSNGKRNSALSGKDIGKDTNFGHRAESTVGNQQMRALGKKIQPGGTEEFDNPFKSAQDEFLGKIGNVSTMNMLTYVQNQIGGDLDFEKEYVDGKLVQVVKGRIDPSNRAGSEKTDKRAFNKYIKDYYQKEFTNAFNANVGGKKATVKSWGFDTIGDFNASQTYNQKTRALIGHDIVKEFSKVKSIKKVSSAKKPKKSKIKKKVKSTIKKRKAVTKQNRPVRVNKARRARTKGKGQAGQKMQVSPLALKSMLQKSLPEAIARKMTGRPTLMYQTGRFAQSAEITDVAPMQRQVEIRYDYMQDPYRVFEPGSGSPLATTGRDPRKIIGGTIRELAQLIMGNRFYVRTKRV
jgi:hypothetical protein